MLNKYPHIFALKLPIEITQIIWLPEGGGGLVSAVPFQDHISKKLHIVKKYIIKKKYYNFESLLKIMT